MMAAMKPMRNSCRDTGRETYEGVFGVSGMLSFAQSVFIYLMVLKS